MEDETTWKDRDQVQGAPRHLTCKQKAILKVLHPALVALADRNHIQIQTIHPITLNAYVLNCEQNKLFL